MFSNEISPRKNYEATSARFANVAFSDGSLLDSFLRRIQKRQPLAVPCDTRRYFVSLPEAGYICLLSAVCGPSNHLLIPKMNPENDLQNLQSIAENILLHYGFKPHIFENESKAKASLESDIKNGYYPLLVTQLDTSGEKPFEEFVGDGETVVDIGMSCLLGIIYMPAPLGTVSALLERCEDLIAHPDLPITKGTFVQLMNSVLPHMRHRETGKSLDEHM